ncbi:MAG TPA: hypothetical protein VJ728_01240 [Candidatus Binataceae bacterium]|nr:hypothetical protein [Candidatus Binataceae bacterium]
MYRMSFLACVIIVLVAIPAWAQNPAPVQPVRIRGTIESFKGDRLTIKAQDGRTVAVTLAPNVRITSNVRRRLDDIKPGDFVGSAAVKGEDGKLHAQEVHIFPESMRGVGEGHRPMGPNPARTMTNATVAGVGARAKRTMTNGVVSGVNGTSGPRTLDLKYKGGEQEIEVAPDVPIVELVTGDRNLLKPGRVVSVFAVRTENGLSARFLNVEKNGVKPLI